VISHALTLIRDHLQAFFALRGFPANSVIVENIGLLETTHANNFNGNVIISLVNVEEESTLKNSKAYTTWPDIRARYQHPPVYLNLYVLFTAVLFGDATHDYYEEALHRLSAVIGFFQAQKTFKNADGSLDLTLELYTLTFEQINHLWASLGGRQVPFVMYKVRLVAITENAVLRVVPLIEEIEDTQHPTA